MTGFFFSKANEHYKFLAVNRHGQGFHNVAKLLYGDDMWDCHWSMQYGDNNFTWAPDPHLTEQGLAEAEIARKGWVRELNLGAPLPQSFYSSPLSRSASTMQITWSEHLKPGQTIVVKEGWRETIGLHVCLGSHLVCSHVLYAVYLVCPDLRSTLNEEPSR